MSGLFDSVGVKLSSEELLKAAQVENEVLKSKVSGIRDLEKENEDLRKRLEKFEKGESAANVKTVVDENLLTKNHTLTELLQKADQETKLEKERMAKFRKQILEIKNGIPFTADKILSHNADEEEIMEFIQGQIRVLLARNKELVQKNETLVQKVAHIERLKDDEIQLLKTKLKTEEFLENLLKAQKSHGVSSDVEKLRSQVKSLEEQLDNSKRLLDDSYKNYQASARTGDSRFDRISESGKPAAYNKQLEIDALKTELVKYKESKASLEAEAKVLEQKAARIQILEEKIHQRDNEIDGLKKEINKIRGDNTPSQNIKLTSLIEARDARIKTLEGEIREYEKQNNNLLYELKEFREGRQDEATQTVDLIQLFLASLFSETSSKEHKLSRVEQLKKILSKSGNINHELEQIMHISHPNQLSSFNLAATKEPQEDSAPSEIRGRARKINLDPGLDEKVEALMTHLLREFRKPTVFYTIFNWVKEEVSANADMVRLVSSRTGTKNSSIAGLSQLFDERKKEVLKKLSSIHKDKKEDTRVFLFELFTELVELLNYSNEIHQELSVARRKWIEPIQKIVTESV